MSPELQAIIAVSIVSIISLAGITTLVVNKNLLKGITLILVSLAAGTLLGDTFFHIIPELNETGINFNLIATFILAGILSFFFLEKLLNWHHCHKYGVELHDSHPNPIAINNIIADGIHNLVDGLIIGAAFLSSTELGIATVIAVILHEIPQEFGDFGVLIHSGYSTTKALVFNFLSAFVAILGTIVALVIGDIDSFVPFLLAYAAGGFIYIAIGDIFVELKIQSNLRKSIVESIVVVLGIILMFALTYLEMGGNEVEDFVEKTSLQNTIEAAYMDNI